MEPDYGSFRRMSLIGTQHVLLHSRNDGGSTLMLIAVAARGILDGAINFCGYLAININGNKGVISTYQWVYEKNPDPVIAFVHNDVTIHDNDWNERIEAEFDDPRVAIVGMGGATGIGTADIYRRPYSIWQLQRIDYYSNQTDWQVHGQQETGSRDVAVVDGFFMAVRRSFLEEIGGWAWMKTRFHCYDTALCLMAHRRGWKVRMVGVNCTHHGGGTSTTAEYKAWLESQGTTQEADHSEPHLWLYEEFKDVLPLRVPSHVSPAAKPQETIAEIRSKVKIGKFADMGIPITGVLHIGANNGYEVQWYLKMDIPKVVCVEPLPSAFVELQRRYGDDPRVEMICCAAGAYFGMGTLTIPEGDGCGSTLLKPVNPQTGFGNYKLLRPLSVPIVRSYVFQKAGLNCLVVDVQGYELSVLAGFYDLQQFDCLNIECSRVPQYIDEAPAQEVVDWLQARGFVAITPIEDHDDILFVKEKWLR